MAINELSFPITLSAGAMSYFESDDKQSPYNPGYVGQYPQEPSGPAYPPHQQIPWQPEPNNYNWDSQGPVSNQETRGSHYNTSWGMDPEPQELSSVSGGEYVPEGSKSNDPMAEFSEKTIRRG